MGDPASRLAEPAAPAAVVCGYEVMEKLGEGGMGVVYRARDVKLNRVVALKMVLGAGAADDRALIRFLAEAEAVAAVRHPNVVQVHAYGDYAGRPYMALEFCPGGTLADRLKDGTWLPARDAAEVVGQVAAGVAAAHAEGIIHRDLKPANVLFDAAGRPKVTDFGLAKRPGGADLTRSGAVMGTPAYMAPEQAGGGTKFVGPAADVWALGVILYECLTGRRAFDADSTEGVLSRVLMDEPTPPRRVVAGLPRDAEVIVRKCLEKAPADRYATAGDLAADLRRFAAGEPISVRRATAAERAYKWARRKPALAAVYALGAAVGLFAAVAGGALWLWRGAEDARARAAAAHTRTEVALTAAEAAQADADRERAGAEAARAGEAGARRTAEAARDRLARVEYARTVDLAHREWKENNLARARSLLDGCPPALRAWEWRYVHRLCHADLLTVRHAHGVTSAAYSADGTRIITSQPGAALVQVCDATTGKELHTLRGRAIKKDQEPAFVSAVFSPDGARVAAAALDGSARVWDLRSGRETHVLVGHDGSVSSVGFSPDGERLVTGSPDQTARVWDARTGRVLLVLDGHTAVVDAAAFSPDGGRVATVSRDDTARVWDARTGEELVRLQRRGQYHRVAYSPDGRRLVTGSADQTARVWDAGTGKELLVLRGHVSAVESVGFSPDGERVVTGSADATARVWDARTGAELHVIRGHVGTIYSAAFSPDGSRVVTGSADMTTRVWDARARPDGLRLSGHTLFVRSIAFSPDGGRLVTASDDQTARVWDARTGRDLVTLRGHTDYVMAAAFSPDGTRLVSASRDKTARVWDARSGTEQLAIRGHTKAVYSAAFSPDGGLVVTGSIDETARTWDARTGQGLMTLATRPDPVSSVRFNPDGSRIVTILNDRTLRAWDTRTGQALPTIDHPDEVHAAAFSPDGGRLVTSARSTRAGRVVRVWDVGTGIELLTPYREATGVFKPVAVSPDGMRVAAGGGDGEVIVWDATPLNRDFLRP